MRHAHHTAPASLETVHTVYATLAPWAYLTHAFGHAPLLYIVLVVAHLSARPVPNEQTYAHNHARHSRSYDDVLPFQRASHPLSCLPVELYLLAYLTGFDSLLWVCAQTVEDELPHLRLQTGAQFGQRLTLSLQQSAMVAIRRITRKHLHRSGTERPHVAGLARIAIEPLRPHVRLCAARHATGRIVACLLGDTDTEVGDEEVAVVVYQYIVGLDVLVYNVMVVQVLESCRHIVHELYHIVLVHTSRHGARRAILTILHNEIRRAIADVITCRRKQVGVLEIVDRRKLLLEVLQTIGVHFPVVREHLQCHHQVVGLGILRFPNLC